MGIVKADAMQVGMVRETTAGVVPATPVFDLWRLTGESLVFTPTVSENDELGVGGRSRSPDDITGATVGGDINFRLSKFAALDEAIQGVLANRQGECPLTGAPGGVVDANRNVVGRTIHTYTFEKRLPNPANEAGAMDITVAAAVPGASVVVTFADGPAVGSGVSVLTISVDGGTTKKFKVPIAAGDTAIVVGGTAQAVIDADTDLTAVDNADGTVTVTPTTGASVDVTSARAGPDTYLYQRFSGSSISLLSITTAPNDPVTGNITIVAGVPTLDDLPVEGATYVPAAQNAVFTAPEVIEIGIGQIMGIGTHCWTSLTITLDSENEAIACIGVSGEKEVALGTMSVSLSGDINFYSQAILETILANQIFGDSYITFSNADDEIYRFDLPGLKPIGGELAAGGTGDIMSIPAEFEPSLKLACDDGGEQWMTNVIVSDVNTEPTGP